MTDEPQEDEQPTHTATPTPQPGGSSHLPPHPGRRRVRASTVLALVAFLTLAVGGFFGYQHFAKHASPPPTAAASDNSFTVSVPPGWRQEEPTAPPGWPEAMKKFQVLYLTSEPHGRNVSVMALPGAGSVSLQEFAQSGMYGVLHGYHAEFDPGGDLQPTTVGGEAALRSSFTTPMGPGIPIAAHYQQYAVLHGGVGYGIAFTSKADEYASATADFDTIVHSWKWSTSQPSFTSQPSTTPAPAQAALEKLLLSPEEINTAMGTTGMSAGRTSTGMTDFSAAVSDKACRPI
jgi:PknH-like protein